MQAETLASPNAAPVYLLGSGQGGLLASAMARAGWRVIEDCGADGLTRRFIASGATLALVDARGDFRHGLSLARTLAASVEKHGCALVMLLAPADMGALDLVFAAGATHFLVDPLEDRVLIHALAMAQRHSDRILAARRYRLGQENLRGELGWHFDRDTGLHLETPLRQRLGLESARFPSLTRFYRLLDRDDRAAARGAIRRIRDGAVNTTFAHDMPGGEGEAVSHHLYAMGGAGGVSGRIAPLRGVPEVEVLATEHDPLTGLSDGSAAHRWLGEHLGGGEALTLLLVSVSRFDMVNAAFGRAAGDALLRSVARRIESAARGVAEERVFVGRLAGADFVIGLIGDFANARARLIGEELARSMSRPFVSGEHVIPLAGRVGLVTALDATAEPAMLLSRALALLGDGRAGDDGVLRDLDLKAVAAVDWHTRLEINLPRALERDEIRILFQPQVQITTGHIVGVEALARWHHPVFGELGAETLFAAAERAGLLVRLSSHVQQRAVTMAAAWPPALRDIRLSVNVTAADIAGEDFVEAFLTRVDRSGFPRNRLTVEITESGLIEDLGHAAGVLTTLRQAGCRVAIDDFGTGYSSLAYLKALPLDYLKIDKKLAEDIAGSARDRIVVRGVIEMARSLGLSVIAEGVEREEQLALLAREGCNYYQGFLCSEPIAAAELVDLIERNQAG